MGDRLPEVHSMSLPYCSIRQHYPVDSLVRSVVHSLTEVVLLEVTADSLDLNEVPELSFGPNGEVYVGAADGILRCDLEEWIPAEHVREDALYDRDGIGLVHVPVSSLHQNWTESLAPFDDPFVYAFRNCHHQPPGGSGQTKRRGMIQSVCYAITA